LLIAVDHEGIGRNYAALGGLYQDSTSRELLKFGIKSQKLVSWRLKPAVLARIARVALIWLHECWTQVWRPSLVIGDRAFHQDATAIDSL
jgi:hypothetical protein